MRLRASSVAALLLLTVGCIHYQAKPIVPADTAAALGARSLRDPGLAQFLAANREPLPAPGAPWGLRALTLAAFYFQPDLDVARADLAAARAGRTTAAARANPAIAPSAGYNTTTPVRTISPWVLGFNLEVPLTTAGKRRHLMAEAAGFAEAARFNLASVAWGVRSGVRGALVDLYAATRGEALLAAQEAILAENAKLLDRQLEAGEVSPFEATQAHLALTSARLAREDGAARRQAARGRLAAAIGVPVAALADVPVDFTQVEDAEREVPPESARREALLNRADVLGALAEYDASQAALALEVARQYPDLSLGPGYEFDQGDNKWFLALTLPLPIMNRNRGPIAEAEARRQAAAARFTAAQSAAMAQIDQAVQGYDAARKALATTTAIGADLDRQEKAAQARFEAGEISRLELGSIRLELVTAELARLDAKVRAEAALGQLEDAMQRSAEPLEWSEKPPERRDVPGAGGPGR
jgi:cobalt-zinc-cadmium efflux system outer membrane protein